MSGGNDAVMGIGYTNVYPIERFFRDARLQMIWTGTNEIMDLLIQHEFYSELLKKESTARDVEKDAGDLEVEAEKRCTHSKTSCFRFWLRCRL
jgi:hypothetical protein